jgi:hypothetical protein
MSITTLLARTLALWALVFWLGGFTFYSAVVIPVLHDRLGSSLEAGLVTQRVTDALNMLGVATIILGWVVTLMKDPYQGPGTKGRRLAQVALGVTSACLAILIALHRVLDRRLDGAEMSGFYPLHRLYLWVSTVQWLANMTLLTCWTTGRPDRCRESQGENPQVLPHFPKPKKPA